LWRYSGRDCNGHPVLSAADRVCFDRGTILVVGPMDSGSVTGSYAVVDSDGGIFVLFVVAVRDMVLSVDCHL